MRGRVQALRKVLQQHHLIHDHLGQVTGRRRRSARVGREDGTIQMSLQETFWAARFAAFDDQFGIPWMINCEKAEESTG